MLNLFLMGLVAVVTLVMLVMISKVDTTPTKREIERDIWINKRHKNDPENFVGVFYDRK